VVIAITTKESVPAGVAVEVVSAAFGVDEIVSITAIKTLDIPAAVSTVVGIISTNQGVISCTRGDVVPPAVPVVIVIDAGRLVFYVVISIPGLNVDSIVDLANGDVVFPTCRGDVEATRAGRISTINGVITGAEVDVMRSRGQRDVIITITSGDVCPSFDGVVTITCVDGVAASATDGVVS